MPQQNISPLSKLSNYLNTHPRLCLWFTFGAAAFLSFFMLGAHPIQEWDEARYGSIAVEMLERSDWINYYFAGQRDTVVSKPPLAIWSIALSYCCFGFNEWALRLPSALAITGAFGFIFLIAVRYTSPLQALFTCLMLMSVRGLIGEHVGRTGDTDAMLILFLLAATYFFLETVDGNKPQRLWLAGALLGCAFWTKGTPSLILLPGWALYTLYRRQVGMLLRQWGTWTGAGLYAAAVGGWATVYAIWGKPYPDNVAYASPLNRLAGHDTLYRFTESAAAPHPQDYLFFFPYLDIRFNLWNYLTYLLLLLLVIQLVRRCNISWKADRGPTLNGFALLAWLPFMLFLAVVPTKHQWYMAPVLPFIGYHVTALIRWGVQQWRGLAIIVVLLLLFTTVRKIYRQSQPEPYPPVLTETRTALQHTPRLVCLSKPRHDYLLYLYFSQPNMQVLPNTPQFPDITQPHVLFTRTGLWEKHIAIKNRYRLLLQGEGYTVGIR